jgi:hypothetical protein
VKWVQEFYFADIGEIMREDLSPPVTGTLEEVEPNAYYRSVGRDGRGLRVPADLDDSICRYVEISKSKVNREKFEIAAYWMDSATGVPLRVTTIVRPASTSRSTDAD